MAGHLDVGVGAGDLVDDAGLADLRQVDRDADDLDEEQLGQERRDVGLDPRAPLVRVAEVADLVAALDARGGDLDVVAQHQLVGLAHRDLGLVLVGAAREGEQLADAIEDALAGVAGIAARARRRGRAGGAGVDAAVGAHAAEGVAVRGLAADAEDLVDELVGHLVLEHASDLEPRPAHDQRARQLERAGGRVPAAEVRRGVGQDEDRSDEPATEAQPVVRVVAPADLAEERGFERGGQRLGRGGSGIEHRSSDSTRLCQPARGAAPVAHAAREGDHAGYRACGSRRVRARGSHRVELADHGQLTWRIELPGRRGMHVRRAITSR